MQKYGDQVCPHVHSALLRIIGGHVSEYHGAHPDQANREEAGASAEMPTLPRRDGLH